MRHTAPLGFLIFLALIPVDPVVLQSAQTADSSPGDAVRTLVSQGDVAFESGDYAAAAGAYIVVSPVQIPVEAQNRLAMSYQMLDRTDEAEAIYRVASVRDPEYAPTHNNLGSLYYARGDYKDAEGRFRESLKHDPGNVATERNLHKAKYARENRRVAEEQAERLLASRAMLIEGVAGEFFEVAPLVDPVVQEELSGLILRGDIFVARKLFEDAIIEYERYVEIDKYDAHVRNKLGMAYQQTQRVNDAAGEYREALRLNPYFAPARNNLASTEQARGNYMLALDYYGQALEIDPESATVLQNLGSCLFALERYEEGLRVYARAVQIDPSLFDRLGSRGGTLVQTTPGNEAMASFYLAKLFAGVGDLDRTMSFLYRAIEEGLNDPRLLEDPAFADLRSEERFARLTESFGDSL